MLGINLCGINKQCMIFIQTIQERLFRATTMFPLMEASGVNVTDGSHKMALDTETTATLPSDRIFVTDASGLSEDLRRLFLPSACQPALCHGLLLGGTKPSTAWYPFDSPGAIGALCEGQQPGKRIDAAEMLRKRKFSWSNNTHEDRSVFLTNGAPAFKQVALSVGPPVSWR